MAFLGNFGTRLISAFRKDGYQNTLSGLGTTDHRGKSPAQFVQECRLGQYEIQGLYDQNWLARRIVDELTDQAFRKPLVIDQKLIENFTRLNHNRRYPNGVVKHGINMGRAFGGAAIVLGGKGTGSALAEPLELDADGAPRAGEIAFLEVVNKYELVSRSQYASNDPDPLKANRTDVFTVRAFGNPLHGLDIHESRLVLCRGIARTGLTQNQMDIDWPWESCLEPVNTVLASYGIAWVAVGQLVQEASMAYMKLRGLVDMLGQEDKAVVDARMALLSVGRQVAKTIFLDAGDGDGHGEEFGRTQVSFSDLPALLEQFGLTISGAAGYPYSILMGQSPTGMNATGDMDLRQFYDRADTFRTCEVKPVLDAVLKASRSSTDYTFQKLWEPTEAQVADVRVKNAGADTQWYTLKVLSAAQILKSRAQDGTLGIEIDDLDAAVAAVEAAEKKEQEMIDAQNAANSAKPDAANSGNSGPAITDQTARKSGAGYDNTQPSGNSLSPGS